MMSPACLKLKYPIDRVADLPVNTIIFANLFLQRGHEEVAIEKIDIRAIRANTDIVLTSFFNGFEFCSDEYDEPDYQTPEIEINNMNAYYKTQLKARATCRSEGNDVSKKESDCRCSYLIK